ncbi:MAG TPA: GlsB/YeaQ/YmgE family stress response membrane protein [Actinomycetes bacterium]
MGFIIWAIVAGLIIGSIAKLFVPGRQDIPIWITILIGVAGALIGNFLAVVLGVRHTFGIDWIRHSLQVATAVVLIMLVVPAWSRRTPG